MSVVAFAQDVPSAVARPFVVTWNAVAKTAATARMRSVWSGSTASYWRTSGTSPVHFTKP